MKHLLVVAVVALALVLTGCGGSGSTTISTADVATAVQSLIESEPGSAGVTVGSPLCDTPVSNIGDVSLCTLALDGGGYSGSYQVTVTLVDHSGHFQMSTPVAKNN